MKTCYACIAADGSFWCWMVENGVHGPMKTSPFRAAIEKYALDNGAAIKWI